MSSRPARVVKDEINHGQHGLESPGDLVRLGNDIGNSSVANFALGANQALGENGTVRMPMQKTFWAVRFGMLVDRFGIPWMINCDLGS